MVEEENYQWHLRNANTDKNLWKFTAIAFIVVNILCFFIVVYKNTVSIEREANLLQQIKTLEIEKQVLIEVKQCR